MDVQKVLIVDDEPDIRNVVSILLNNNGYAVRTACDALQAIEEVRLHADLDLIIMDVMMPGMDGIEALRHIREFSKVPALFLTAKTQESDKAEAYENGGDDYLAKPFSQNELLMKAASLIRRYRVYNVASQMRPDDPIAAMQIDSDRQRVLRAGADLGLTDTEFELFSFFLSRRGRPSDIKLIYETVWGEKYLPSAANTVMVHILNLRKKLEDDPAHPAILKTIWGKGYQID